MGTGRTGRRRAVRHRGTTRPSRRARPARVDHRRRPGPPQLQPRRPPRPRGPPPAGRRGCASAMAPRPANHTIRGTRAATDRAAVRRRLLVGTARTAAAAGSSKTKAAAAASATSATRAYPSIGPSAAYAMQPARTTAPRSEQPPTDAHGAGRSITAGCGSGPGPPRGRGTPRRGDRRPSRTVACTTARISGDRCRNAPPRSPYSTPRRTRSSALAAGRRRAATCSSGSTRRPGRPRSRDTGRRIAMPYNHAATSPSPRHRWASLHTATKVSWRTSATTSGLLQRRRSRAATHGACRSSRMRIAARSPAATAATSSGSSWSDQRRIPLNVAPRSLIGSRSAERVRRCPLRAQMPTHFA